MPWITVSLSTIAIATMAVIVGIECQTAPGGPTQAYVIDVLVVAEDISYKFPDGDLEQYVSLLIHQANKRLDTISEHANFTVQLQIADFMVDQDILLLARVSLLSGRTKADHGLELFTKWLLNNRLADRYDHAILLTGRELEGDYDDSVNGVVAGRAYVGTLCNKNGKSISIIHEPGGFQSTFFVAHEIGHSLGALHDGEGGAASCRGEDRYLMATVSQPTSDGTADHPWYLSACSAKATSDVIGQVTASVDNCLATTSSPVPEFAATATSVAGQLYDANAQCRGLYGSTSRICLGPSFSAMEEICSSMFCSKPSGSCAQHYAAEGTSCGNKMWCSMGRCVRSEAAPEIGECPYGDSALGLIGGATCKDSVAARGPGVCYQDSIREACCETCADNHSGNDVCPYGDKKSGCTPDLCELIDPSGTLLAEDCCGTCGYDAVHPCQDASDVDGYTCSERTTLYGSQACYNTTVAYHCCATCAGERNGKAGCEYGDRVLGGYCAATAKRDYSGCRAELNTICCNTCDPDSLGNKPDPDSGSCVMPSLFLALASVLLLKLL